MANIPATLQVTGTIHSEEDLVIEGRVKGDVYVTGTLTISEQAQVEADIRGSHVHVRGTVRGTISASERIEMAVSSSITGNASANHIIIADGARFNGRIDMNRRTIAGLVARHTAKRA